MPGAGSVSYQAPRRKVQKEKKKYFPFLLAGSEKLLTFATPIRTAGLRGFPASSDYRRKPAAAAKNLKKGLVKRKRMPNFANPNNGKTKEQQVLLQLDKRELKAEEELLILRCF